MTSGDVPTAGVGDVNARRAIDAPADGPLVAIAGRAASGKTETLARRYVDLLERDASLTIAATIVTAATAAGATKLAARIETLLPPDRVAEGARGRYFGVSLDRLAFDVLAENALVTGLAYDLESIDAYEAEEIFERAIAPLLSAEWSEYLGPEIDPEIPGLRAPDRFAVAVLRLIRRLRAARITPDEFYAAALRGATKFYAATPNLASPALLEATNDEHRSSLTVSPAELDRQRRRELDLAKIVTKLYRSYLDELVAHGCLTPADAIAEACRVLAEHPVLVREYRRRLRIAVVDDAQDLLPGDLRLLETIFGPSLAGVSVAGDPDAATQVFAGARPDRFFGPDARAFELQANYGIPDHIAAVVRKLLDPAGSPAIPPGDAVRVHRAATLADEAAFVARRVGELLASGTSPGRIAVVHRSLRTLGRFEDALVDADIPIALNGDGDLFARHDVLDALALLWATLDPFAHDWLLRALQLPLTGLADATLAILCGEPTSPQEQLFEQLPTDERDSGRRWDRRRDVRLGTNVVRGDRDGELEADARQRVVAFRVRRRTWQRFVTSAGAAEAARFIIDDAGLCAPRTGETVARTRRRRAVVSTLLDLIARYAHRHPAADLRAALAYCERVARNESGPLIDDPAIDAVAVAAIDRIKTRRFDHVFVVDVRAGSFPPYYVPDAFLFSLTWGMVPKDSVGDAITSRTAKFTWYVHRMKLKESYAREDRRALAVALSRADRSATVSAAGRPTRAKAAPEMLAELEAFGLTAASATNAEPDRSPSAPHPHENLDATGFAQEAALALEPVEPRTWSAERVAELMVCVDCAPRRTIASTFAGSLTLLTGPLPGSDERIVERDIAFAFGLAGGTIYGTLPALVRHAGKLFATSAHAANAAVAFAMRGLGGRVVQDEFFVELADSMVTGPHPIEVDTVIALADRVLRGELSPRCSEHARASIPSL